MNIFNTDRNYYKHTYDACICRSEQLRNINHYLIHFKLRLSFHILSVFNAISVLERIQNSPSRDTTHQLGYNF